MSTGWRRVGIPGSLIQVDYGSMDDVIYPKDDRFLLLLQMICRRKSYYG